MKTDADKREGKVTIDVMPVFCRIVGNVFFFGATPNESTYL